MEISCRFGFDAAHRFENYPVGHTYRNLHGHSFQVEVALRGKTDPASGFVADFGELERACAQVKAALDHRMLNEVQGLGTPSLENLWIWVWGRLAPQFQTLARVQCKPERLVALTLTVEASSSKIV